MTELQQRAAAKKFAKKWKDYRGNEQKECLFWTELLHNVFGVDDTGEFISFREKSSFSGITSWADGYIPTSKVLIEQRRPCSDLDTVSLLDNSDLPAAFNSALKFSNKLILSKKPRYIIVCNYRTFRIHDLDKQGYEKNYVEIKLADLENKLHLLDFIVGEDTDTKKSLSAQRKNYCEKNKTRNTPEDFAWYYICKTIKAWSEKMHINKRHITPVLIKRTFIEKNRLYAVLKCLSNNAMDKKTKVPDRCELFKLAAAMELDKEDRQNLISVMQPDMMYPHNDVENAWESCLQKHLNQSYTQAQADMRLYYIGEELMKIAPEYKIFKDMQRVEKLIDEQIGKERDKSPEEKQQQELSH